MKHEGKRGDSELKDLDSDTTLALNFESEPCLKRGIIITLTSELRGLKELMHVEMLCRL